MGNVGKIVKWERLDEVGVMLLGAHGLGVVGGWGA